MKNIEIEGMWFIEDMSFKGFKEGVGLKDCIDVEEVRGVRVKGVGGD